jgi:DNA-binding CsgD family transcriptional regulator
MGTEASHECPTEQFSELVGQIYDTVLDPARWTSVLALIGAFVGAARVTLIMEDSIYPSRSIFYHSSTDSEFLTKYLKDYLMINPMRLATLGQRAVAGDIILTTDFSSTEEYARSRFSRELLAERDLVDIAVGVLERTATTITVLSLKRSSAQGFADENVRRKIGLVAPHVQRAASIGRVFEQNLVEASTMTAVFDRLKAAVFLLEHTGVIVYANRAAQRLLQVETSVRQVGRFFVPRDADAALALKNALASTARGDLATEQQRQVISFDSTPGRALLGTIMPFTGGDRRGLGLRLQAAALLSVQETAVFTPSDAPSLAQIYRLTPRETTVLMTIVECRGVPEAADILGLSVGTTRSYLKSVFQKTGATRQADLVKLVAGISSPFG